MIYKRSKYGAIKTFTQGIKFDSKLESDGYLLLKSSKLEFDLQPKIVLQEKFKSKEGKNIGAITYTPDFVVYWTAEDQLAEKHYIDIKGMETTVFKLKKKLFLKKLENEKYSYFYTIKTPKELELLIKKIQAN